MPGVNYYNGSTWSEVAALEQSDGQTAPAYRWDGSQWIKIYPAILDSGDLHARYDATELDASDGDSISTWDDQTGNGYDLTAGTSAPQYVENAINGNPAVSFDGVDDFLDVAFATISQPFHIFVVLKSRDAAPSSTLRYFGSDASASWAMQQGDGFVNLFASSNLTINTTTDTDPHIYGDLFDGASSAIRQDGSELGSGDPGLNGMDGVEIGSNNDGDNPAPVDVGEMLIYPQDKSGIQSDVEQYLADKWGVTI